jgi:hypothetical protein
MHTCIAALQFSYVRPRVSRVELPVLATLFPLKLDTAIGVTIQGKDEVALTQRLFHDG